MTTKIDRLYNDINSIRHHLRVLREMEHHTGSSPALTTAYESLELSVESLSVAEAELRQQQEALEEAQSREAAERQRYFHLFEYAPDAYLVTDGAGSILEANRAAARLFNVSQRYLQGKPLAIYIAFDQRREFRTFLYQIYRQKHEESLAKEFMIQSRHGEMPVPVSITVLPIVNEEHKVSSMRWILRDISRRRHAEVRLHETNQLLTSLIEAAPLAIFALDTEGLVTLWNRAAEELTGWQADESIGLPPFTVPEHLLDDYHQRLRAVLDGRSYLQIEREWQRRDGTSFPVRLSTAPLLDNDGQVAGVIELAADISEELRIRDELRHSKARLREARAEEQRRLARDLHDSAVQRLVGLQFQLAHHRRTVTNETTTRSLPDGLKDIEEEIKGIIQILRGVISDLRPPGLEEYGLCRALEGYVAKLNRARSPDVPETEVECSNQDLPISLALATTLFRIAQEGLVNIYRHADARHARVCLTHDDQHLTLTVWDDGRGFTVPTPLSILSYDQHFGLVGIAEAVEVTGGTLDIASVLHQGTTLTVRLPLQTQ